MSSLIFLHNTEFFFCVLVIFCRQEAINLNLQGTNVIKAKQLMDATIAQLNEHKKKVSVSLFGNL